MPTVSIIVPAYNVEHYVERTINSVLSQTFEDWELIIINDGSTDNTGLVCHRFEKIDSRILVIDQPNRGVSAARNLGIERSRGLYVTFLDADDLLAPSFIETLLIPLQDGNFDAATTRLTLFTDEDSLTWERNKQDEFNVLTGDKIVCAVLYHRNLSESIAGFLAKRSIWEGVSFPEGYGYEDLFTIPTFFSRCSRIIVSEQSYYGYRQREGSAMHPTVLQTKRLYDLKHAIDEVESRFKTYSSSVKLASQTCVVLNALRLKRLINQSTCNTVEKADLYSYVQTKTRAYLYSVLLDRNCPLSMKIRIIVLRWCPKLVSYIQKIGSWRNAVR